MRIRRFLAAAILVGGTGLVGVPGTAAAHAEGTTTGEPTGHFTCEATSARVRTPLVNAVSTQANPGGGACEDDFAQALAVAIPGSLLPPVVTARVLSAQIDADPGGEPGARSDAAVAELAVKLGLTTLRADVLRSHAVARCEGGKPVLKGASEVIGLSLGNQSGSFSRQIRITDPANPLLNIWLNEQTTTTDAAGNQVLTQRAIHIFGLQANGFLVDIVLGESVVDVHGDPCGSAPPECSDGQDNDGDKHTDYPDDPGCSSPEDNDESDDPKPAACSDGYDNDGDKLTDFPDDPGCSSPDDDDEHDDKK